MALHVSLFRHKNDLDLTVRGVCSSKECQPSGKILKPEQLDVGCILKDAISSRPLSSFGNRLLKVTQGLMLTRPEKAQRSSATFFVQTRRVPQTKG